MTWTDLLTGTLLLDKDGRLLLERELHLLERRPSVGRTGALATGAIIAGRAAGGRRNRNPGGGERTRERHPGG